MSLASRISLAAALVAVAFLTRAAVAPMDVEQRKQAAVESGLRMLGQQEQAASVMPRVAGAHALAALAVDSTAQSARVTLTTTGQPPYKSFVMEGGRKVVVDLYDTVNILDVRQSAACDATFLEGVRNSFFSVEPSFVSRVVVDLAHPGSYHIEQADGTLTISLAGGSAQEPALPKVDPAVQQKVATLRDGLDSIALELQTEQALTELNLAYKRPAAPAPVQPAVENATQMAALPAFQPEAVPVAARPLASLLALTYPVPLVEDEAVPLLVANSAEGQAPAPAPDGAPAEQKPADAPAAPEGDKPADAPAPAEGDKPADAPAPPEKRDAAPDAPQTPVLTKMKQILTDFTEKPNPAAEGLSAPATPAAAPAPTPAPVPAPAAPKAAEPKAPEPPAYQGNPMDQIVNIDFREMELSNVVALLAQKAGINVIAGEDLKGVVTANLKNVTLRRAMETVLRMNGLGMVEEEGIYHIIPYEEAQASQRVTQTLKLENAKVKEIRTTLEDVLKGSPDDTLMSISTNENTNVLVIAGPDERVAEFVRLARELDVAKPVTPTATEAIKINNAEPKDLVAVVSSMLTPEIGKAAIDERSRHLIVTDVPVILEQVRTLLAQIDMPVKQVSIDAMIIDAVLADNSETGVDWIINSVQHLNRRGKVIGSLQDLGLETDATANPVTPGIIGNVPLTGRLTMGVLTDNLDIRGVIAAEVRNDNARLLANPVITTIENKEAMINISQEIPYQQFTQSLTGPPMATTAFKNIGIVLEVMPRVTHDDHVIAELSAKQSDTKGEVNSIPVEDKRETETTLRMRNGQTIFIGGLRRFDDEKSVRKIPVLGDIPVMNAMFRRTLIEKESTELLIFLTCNVLPDDAPALAPELQQAHDEIDSMPKVPQSECELGKDILRPNRPSEDPFWKWRRTR